MSDCIKVVICVSIFATVLLTMSKVFIKFALVASSFVKRSLHWLISVSSRVGGWGGRGRRGIRPSVVTSGAIRAFTRSRSCTVYSVPASKPSGRIVELIVRAKIWRENCDIEMVSERLGWKQRAGTWKKTFAETNYYPCHYLSGLIEFPLK